MIRTIASAATAAALVVGGAAFAGAYTGTPLENGQGFVGKGELQTPWSWNNQALQSRAKDVSFTVESESTYEYVCQWVTGEGTRGEKTHKVTQTRSSSVVDTVAYDTRVKNQITGFRLSGFSATTPTGVVPVVGDSCLGEGAEGTVISVSEQGSSANLLAHYPGLTSIVLQPTVSTTTG
jgi:hypothetical protein